MKRIFLACCLAASIQGLAQETGLKLAKPFLLKEVLENLDATHKRAVIVDMDTQEELTVIISPEDVYRLPNGLYIVRPNIVGPSL